LKYGISLTVYIVSGLTDSIWF